jgi:hypothetical protein
MIRVIVIIALCVGCGVKSFPRPVQTTPPPPVTVPGSQPTQPSTK